MYEIQINKQALVAYRSTLRRMTRDQLSTCSGIPSRTLARLEDPKQPAKLGAEKLARLAHCLSIPQHKLWADIPDQAQFFGIKVDSSQELFEAIINSNKVNRLDVRSLPTDKIEEQKLVALATIVDREKDANHETQPLSSLDELQTKIELNEIFNVLSEPTEYGLFLLPISIFDVNEYYKYWDDETVGDEWRLRRSWKKSTDLIFVSSHQNSKPPSTPFTSKDVFNRTGWINDEFQWQPDEDGRREILAADRYEIQ